LRWVRLPLKLDLPVCCIVLACVGVRVCAFLVFLSQAVIFFCKYEYAYGCVSLCVCVCVCVCTMRSNLLFRIFFPLLFQFVYYFTKILTLKSLMINFLLLSFSSVISFVQLLSFLVWIFGPCLSVHILSLIYMNQF